MSFLYTLKKKFVDDRFFVPSQNLIILEEKLLEILGFSRFLFKIFLFSRFFSIFFIFRFFGKLVL